MTHDPSASTPDPSGMSKNDSSKSSLRDSGGRRPTPDPAPAASKKKPLDFVVDATSDACKALKVGKATDGKATAKLKATA